MVGLGEKIIWLVGAAAVYLLFCVYCAWRGARSGGGTPGGSSLALSAAALTGWMFVAHIGLIYRDGLPFAALGLACIILPLFANCVALATVRLILRSDSGWEIRKKVSKMLKAR